MACTGQHGHVTEKGAARGPRHATDQPRIDFEGIDGLLAISFLGLHEGITMRKVFATPRDVTVRRDAIGGDAFCVGGDTGTLLHGTITQYPNGSFIRR